MYIQVISSSWKNQLSAEIQEHGLFTQFFIEGLSGKAFLNEENWMTTNELTTWIEREIDKKKKEMKKEKLLTQIPNCISIFNLQKTILFQKP